MCKNVRLPGTSTWLCRCAERGVTSCSDDARLPGMPGCPEICPAARNYARKYVRLPDCPELCPEICPVARNYARLPGCPKCPAARKYARKYARNVRNVRLPGIGTTATLGRPTASVSGAAGSLHRPARAVGCHNAKRSRPTQGPRQRRPLHAMLGGL